MKIRTHVKEKDIYMGITHIRVIPSQFWNLPFSSHCSCLFARSNFSEWTRTNWVKSFKLALRLLVKKIIAG